MIERLQSSPQLQGAMSGRRLISGSNSDQEGLHLSRPPTQDANRTVTARYEIAH